MGRKVFLNGELLDREKAVVSVFDHGLLYGDGVFEGIRAYSRNVFRLKEHIDRLYNSADAIALKIPVEREKFIEDIVNTLKSNELDDAYIRAVVTRGAGDLGLDPRKCHEATYFIITDKIKLYPQEFYDNGLALSIAKTRRNHPEALDPRVKSLNYLNNILAKIEAIEAGTEEALMLSVEGYVAECTGDNIFIIEDGELITPSSDLGALEGITRQAVIDLAEEKGIKISYRKMLAEQIIKADECFLTGTAAEIIPVTRIDDNVIGSGSPGEITKDLLASFRDLTKTDGVSY